jgi:hypothetical protein
MAMGIECHFVPREPSLSCRPSIEKLVQALNRDNGKCEQARDEQRGRLKARLADVQRRIDQAYTDKLDRKIPEDFWGRKSAEWRKEESEIEEV